MSGFTSDDGYMDRLRLSAENKHTLLKQVDTEEATHSGRSRRRSERCPYTPKDPVLMSITSPGQQDTPYRIHVRNISDHGAGIFHSSFLHQDTPVQLTFATDDGETLLVDGHVKRCGFVSGKVHDIGIKFTTPISAASLLGGDDEKEEASSKKTSDLKLSVLYVEDDPVHQRMVSFLMGQMGVAVKTVSTGQEALSAVTSQPYDMILLDMELPDLPGDQVIVRLRRNGLTVPIVASSTDETVADKVIEAGGNMLLPKPITQAKLTDMIHRWGPKNQASNAEPLVLLSSLWGHTDARPMLSDFLVWLREQSKEVAELATMRPSDLTDRVIALCQELQLLAGGMGYPTLCDQAHHLMQQIGNDSRPETYKDSLSEFLEMCERAHSVLAQSIAA